jgi:hypothetical protein
MVGISTGVSLLSSNAVKWEGALEFVGLTSSYSYSGVVISTIYVDFYNDGSGVRVQGYDSLGSGFESYGTWFTVSGADPTSYLSSHFESKFTILSGSATLGHSNWKQLSLLDGASRPYFRKDVFAAGTSSCQIRVEVREILNPSNASSIDITLNVTAS